MTADIKIIDKVKKLLNMAGGDAAGGEHERDTAMKMALKLLAKHNLSMADCQTVKEGRLSVTMEAELCPWRKVVGGAIAKLFFSSFYFQRVPGKQRNRFTFVGLESNIETSLQMTKFLIKSLTREVKLQRAAHGYTSAWETSFFNAASIRISQRCYAIRAEAEAESTPAAGTGLVLASLYAQEEASNLRHIAEEMGLVLKTGKPSKMSFGDLNGAAAGREFGDNVSLSNNIATNPRANPNAPKLN